MVVSILTMVKRMYLAQVIFFSRISKSFQEVRDRKAVFLCMIFCF